MDVEGRKGWHMGMVYCRGCGKEIHETAVTCPHCGAPQIAVQACSRSVPRLIGWTIVWTVTFWFVAILMAGMVAGVLNPENAQAAGQKVGEALSGIFFLVSLCGSTLLTVLGKLPGTHK